MTRDDVYSCAVTISKGMAEVLVATALSRYDKLTADEVKKFSVDGDNGFFIARVLLLSAAHDGVLERSHSAACIQDNRLVPKLSRLIAKRP